MSVVLVGVIALLQRLNQEVASRGVASIDVTRYRLHVGDRWTCDAWVQRLERALLHTGELSANDRDAIDELVADLGSLSFVSDVGEPEVDWPDGLSVPLRLRQPVACLRVGADFLPVAADGTVLAGYSYAPHPAYGGFLPVLGPHGLDGDPVSPFQPGDVLTHPAHRAALDVALSLWNHVDHGTLERLGRTVIDASRDEAFDGKPGGVRIDLEGARRIHFGRPPGVDAPGELPTSAKWQSVSQGLARWEEGEDFDAFDVRWDEPAALRYDQSVGGDR